MSTCPRSQLTPGQIATIVRLERHGRDDLAEAIRDGSMRCGPALEAAGLRQPRPAKAKRAKAKPRPVANENEPIDYGPPTEVECVAISEDARTVIEFDHVALKRLDAAPGDTIVVLADMVGTPEGPPQVVELLATMGTSRTPHSKKGEPRKPPLGRIWIAGEHDVDSWASVTLRRRRRV